MYQFFEHALYEPRAWYVPAQGNRQVSEARTTFQIAATCMPTLTEGTRAHFYDVRFRLVARSVLNHKLEAKESQTRRQPQTPMKVEPATS